MARFAANNPAKIAIVHADGASAAEYLRQRIRDRLGELDIPIVVAGAVITTHVGLGAIAVGVRRLEVERPVD